MDKLAHLQTFADVSVATAAMSAILIALRAERIDDPRLVWGLGGLLSWSLAALFFSLFPLILDAYEIGIETTWKVGLLGVALHAFAHAIGFGGYDMVLLNRGIDVDCSRNAEPVKMKPLMYLVYSMIGIFSAWAAFSALNSPSAGSYFLALVVQISFAFWLFLFFLITYPSKSSSK